MLASNTINYMNRVAFDLLGYKPEGKPHTPQGEISPTEWLMKADGQILDLVHHMSSFGYTVSTHQAGWIGISGYPTNYDAVRALEVRFVEARLEWLRSQANDGDIMQLTSRL